MWGGTDIQCTQKCMRFVGEMPVEGQTGEQAMAERAFRLEHLLPPVLKKGTGRLGRKSLLVQCQWGQWGALKPELLSEESHWWQEWPSPAGLWLEQPQAVWPWGVAAAPSTASVPALCSQRRR